MSEHTFGDKGSPSKSKYQDKSNISSQKPKLLMPSSSDAFEESDSFPVENKEKRPSSWDESDNELSYTDGTPKTENGRIYSAESKKNAEPVAIEINKIKEQFFQHRKKELLGDSEVKLLEYSNQENRVDGKFKFEIDRRQTPARVRRRTKSSNSTSPTHDSRSSLECTVKTEIHHGGSHQKNNELEASSNIFFNDLLSELLTSSDNNFNAELSTLYSKDNETADEDKENNEDEKTHLDSFSVEAPSEEDFYYCRTLRKLSQILEVEEGKKDTEGSGMEGIESLDEKSEEKLSETSLTPKSSHQLDDYTLSTASTSSSRKPSTHAKISLDGFCPSEDAIMLEKLTNFKRNSKGSISDRTYRPIYKNSENNGFIILTPKSAKTEIDVKDGNLLDFEKSTQDLKNYSFFDSVWTENFIKDYQSKESFQENFQLQLSIPTSEETSPKKNKESSFRSDNLTGINSSRKDSQLFKSSPQSMVNFSKSSSRSLKVEDVKSPHSETGSDSSKRQKRREKIKKNFSIEPTAMSKIGVVKTPKCFQSEAEKINSDYQKSIKRDLREDCKSNNFNLENTNYTTCKLTESFEKSQKANKSSEANFFTKQKKRDNSPNAIKSQSPKSNKNFLYSSSESFKKDSGRSVESNNSFQNSMNNAKENLTWCQSLKSPGSDRNVELDSPLSVNSSKCQDTFDTDRSESSSKKNKSPVSSKTSKKSRARTNRRKYTGDLNSTSSRTNFFNSSNEASNTLNLQGLKSNDGSKSNKNFQEKEKLKILESYEGQEIDGKNGNKFKIEYEENQSDVQEMLSFRTPLNNQNEKNEEICYSEEESKSFSKSSSRSSNRNFTLKIEDDILDKEKIHRSNSSSGKSSHRTLSIIDEVSHETLRKSLESVEERTSKIQSRQSSGSRSARRSENFIDVTEKNIYSKLENREEKETEGSKSDRTPNTTFLGEENKNKHEKNSLESIMWQDLIERFGEFNEDGSINSAAVNKFPGFPRKKSQSQSSRKSTDSSSYDVQNEYSQFENRKSKDLSNLESTTEDTDKNLKLQTKIKDGFLYEEPAEKQEKLGKHTSSSYFPSENNSSSDQQSKMFYFDVKMMDNQRIGEFGDVTCCSIGKFEITSSGKPNAYGDGDQGERTNWDPIAANSVLEKTKKEVEKKSQRQLWTEVYPNYEYENSLLSTQSIKQTDLNFKEYFPINSFKVLSAAVQNYPKSQSVKSLEEEIKVKEKASVVVTPTLNQRLTNSLKCIAPSLKSCNEIKLKQSAYTSTADLFEMTFQNSTEEKDISNLNIFLANKPNFNKNIRPKNWLTIGHKKCEIEKSGFRKNRLKKKELCKESVATSKMTSSGRSKPSIPPLRFKNRNCFQNFYKRLISTFCITSHSSAATSN